MASFKERSGIREKVADDFRNLKFLEGFGFEQIFLDGDNHGYVRLDSFRGIYFLDDSMLFVDNVGTPSEVRVSYEMCLARRENLINHIFSALNTI